MRFGMQALASRALITISGVSAIFFIVATTMAGVPPLWAFMTYGLVIFFCLGMLFGNLTAMAFNVCDTPMGELLLNCGHNFIHIAGQLKCSVWQGREKVDFFIDDAAKAS